MYILGVDSGGTKTKCAVVNDEYELLGVGDGGPGNYFSAGERTARNNVETAIQSALADAGVADTETVIAGFGMGSLDTEEDYTVISGFLDDLEGFDESYLVNDVVISYYSITAGNPGIAVVAGTGAIMYGRNADGDEARSSGWGWLIGDEGSGFYAARRGLQAAAKAHDGRGRDTVLLDQALEHFQEPSFERIFQHVHEDLDHPRDISSFAVPLAQAADDGDDVALSIVEDAAAELVDGVTAVQAKLQIAEPVTVGCTGGFGTSSVVSRAFEERLTAELGSVDVTDPVQNPVVGAIALVADRRGEKLSRSALQELDGKIDHGSE